MPSIGSHMARAHVIAEALRNDAIDADRGAYYFGSSAPDIRVITRRDRRETHFFDLDQMAAQDSVEAMFEQHPTLRQSQALDPSTLAFMAGYLTHLAMDETYIETLYRDYFGARSSLRDDLRAPLLDRALQYELNRRELEQGAVMRTIREALAQCPTANGVPFIADEHLAEWRDVVVDFASQGPTWDRFPGMMNIHLKRAGFTDAEIEQAVADGPALVAESLGHVGESRVAEFVDDATERATERVRRYLR